VFVLRLAHRRPRTVDAALALARRGLTLLRAKRAMEELLDTGRSFVDLPLVEDAAALAADLAPAGIAAAPAQPPRTIDVRALRRRLGLSREKFAMRFGLEVETLRNWEIGRREPDTTARSYLHAIANDPERVEQAYAPTRPADK
jgi:putative transcriptional regulator